MTTDRRRLLPGGRDDDRPLRSALRVTIERSDDGRHWIAAAVPSLSALAGTSRPKARMLRLKIDAGSLPAEDMWP